MIEEIVYVMKGCDVEQIQCDDHPEKVAAGLRNVLRNGEYNFYAIYLFCLYC